MSSIPIIEVEIRAITLCRGTICNIERQSLSHSSANTPDLQLRFTLVNEHVSRWGVEFGS